MSTEPLSETASGHIIEVMGEPKGIPIGKYVPITSKGQIKFYLVPLAKISPLRISLERTRRNFKELVLDLMEKDVISWLNTLSLEELVSLLERAAARNGGR